MIKLKIYFKRPWCTFAIEIEKRIFFFNGSKVIYTLLFVLKDALHSLQTCGFTSEICGRHVFPKRTKATQKRS